MLDAIKMYKNQNEDKGFPFMHLFNKLQGCKKWDTIRQTLNKEGVGEDGPADPAGVSTGCPICNNKDKSERNATPTLAAMYASLEKMISSFSTENKEAADRAVVVWKAILEKQDMKIEYERTKVEVAKMKAEAATMKGHQRSDATFVGQNVSRIQDLDGPIDEGVARDVPRAHRPRGSSGASCVSVHDSPGPSTFMTPPTPSTFMPPLPAPSMCMPPLVTVDPVATMELPPGLADDEDVVEVEVPMTLFVTPQATA
jgi:hypothetical protein